MNRQIEVLKECLSSCVLANAMFDLAVGDFFAKPESHLICVGKPCEIESNQGDYQKGTAAKL